MPKQALAAPPDPTDRTPTSALPAAERALELRRAGRDLEAMEIFRQEWEQSGSVVALAQLALAEQAAGRWVDARLHLTRALEQGTDPWLVEHEAALRQALLEIESRLGSIDVVCNVVGADVLFDGRSIGHTPLARPVDVVAGRGALEVRAAGYLDARRQVDVDAGALSRVEVVLVPRERPNEVTSPAERSVLGPSAAPSGSSTLLYVGLGLTAAGLGAGITGQVVREVNLAIWNDDRRCDRYDGPGRALECPEEDRAWRTGQTLAIAGWVGAGVFGGWSLYLWLDRPAANSRRSASGRTSCGLSVAGLSCAGHF